LECRCILRRRCPFRDRVTERKEKRKKKKKREWRSDALGRVGVRLDAHTETGGLFEAARREEGENLQHLEWVSAAVSPDAIFCRTSQGLFGLTSRKARKREKEEIALVMVTYSFLPHTCSCRPNTPLGDGVGKENRTRREPGEQREAALNVLTPFHCLIREKIREEKHRRGMTDRITPPRPGYRSLFCPDWHRSFDRGKKKGKEKKKGAFRGERWADLLSRVVVNIDNKTQLSSFCFGHERGKRGRGKYFKQAGRMPNALHRRSSGVPYALLRRNSMRRKFAAEKDGKFQIRASP